MRSISEKYLFESKSNKPTRDNQIKYRILLHFDFESASLKVGEIDFYFEATIESTHSHLESKLQKNIENLLYIH